jgi:hypothetical protein
MTGVSTSELEDLRRLIQSARDRGRHPTMMLISAQSWFRVKALYVEQTGMHRPTFRDVFGVDAFFIEGEVPYVVVED